MSTSGVSIHTGDVFVRTGDVSTPNGDVFVRTGDVSTPTGDVFVRTGDVSTPTGDVFVRTGDVHTPTGDVLVRNGDVSTTGGDIFASNDDASIPNGDVSISTGDVIMSTNDISTPAEIGYSVPINVDISMPLDVDATESESGGVSVDVPTDCPTEAAIAGRSKKRKADESKWFKVVNKNKREKGEVYMGRKYETGSRKFKIVEKPGKELGERCYCKSVGLKCGDVPDEKRDEIFKEVWSMSWSQREILVKSLVHRNNVGQHRVQQSESSRQNTLKYHLNVGIGLVPVCKKMFINTTGITKTFIRRHVLDEGDISNKTIPPNQPSIKRETIKEFLASLPLMPSHYCRKSSSKKYFDRSFDSKMVYKVYLDWCRERENAECASRQVFNDVLDAENYAIFRPRKDLCDTCESYEAGNIDEATYLTHRLRKEQAQNSKSEDKLLATGSNGKI
ncbi:hypothetical protein PoB_003529200 [Plakobranchus ocellatus]|uniref:Uncharacterized protein n=1 Tax=Plakobranchus ocellatus TaxID=259542 RepID=A0AAV4APE8_9GAST|nr:hypothetical protein PoB_003529200 [Plakobranchus ocellatus]